MYNFSYSLPSISILTIILWIGYSLKLNLFLVWKTTTYFSLKIVPFTSRVITGFQTLFKINIYIIANGIDGKVYNSIKSMYETGSQSCIRINNKLTQWFQCKIFPVSLREIICRLHYSPSLLMTKKCKRYQRPWPWY